MASANSRVRLAAASVLGVYLALAVGWVFYIPRGGGIDEPRHVRYVQIVAEEGRLPTPAEKDVAISHHPPLHYVLMAPVYLATRGMGDDASWYALRLAQVPMGAIVLLLTFAMVRRLVPEHPWPAVAAMASIALLPHFQLISALISNDMTTVLFCTLMLYFMVRTVREPRHTLRWAALAGLAGGLAALTRTNSLSLLPPVFVAVAVAPLVRTSLAESDDAAQAAARAPADSLALRNAIAFGGAFALTGGLGLARHIGIWGGIDPDPPWPEQAWPVHTFGGRFLRAAGGLFRSWWAQVGWVPGPHSSRPLTYSSLWPRPNLETPIFALAAVLTVVAAVGCLILLVRYLRTAGLRDRGLVLATFAGCWLLTAGALVYNAMYVNPGRFEGGRYALPAVAAIMVMPIVGLLSFPRRWRIALWAAMLGLLCSMTAISFWEMHTYLIPTFAR